MDDKSNYSWETQAVGGYVNISFILNGSKTINIKGLYTESAIEFAEAILSTSADAEAQKELGP